jgi:glycosyltransferase involved in cell wall biosynthesis
MNSVSEWALPPYEPTPGVVRFLFAGNLGLGRWKVLGALGRCLEELSSEERVQCELSIYSLMEPEPDVLRQLQEPSVSRFLGALDSAQLRNAMAGVDVLVLVEAFDRAARHITRLSISTKIPEYLAAGRCILAVGPDDVASIQYLAEHDLGVVVTTRDSGALKASLRQIIRSGESRVRYASRGPEAARDRHGLERVTNDMRDIMFSAVRADCR